VADGVEAAAEEQGRGDDGGQGTRDGGDLHEQGCDQQEKQRPESVGRSPELLREECAFDGGKKNDGKKSVEGGRGAEAAEIGDGEGGGKEQQVRRGRRGRW
jgi:hypothetical protein